MQRPKPLSSHSASSSHANGSSLDTQNVTPSTSPEQVRVGLKQSASTSQPSKQRAVDPVPIQRSCKPPLQSSSEVQASTPQIPASEHVTFSGQSPGQVTPGGRSSAGGQQSPTTEHDG